MIVRFDSSAILATLSPESNASNPPIGVDGDAKGGISEAEKIVGEVRRGMGDDVVSGGTEVEGDAIREEEEKEVGPEVDEEGLKSVRMKDAGK